MSQGKVSTLLGILIGINLTLGVCVLAMLQQPAREAIGATADSVGSVAIATAQTGSGNKEAVYVFDMQSKKLVVYSASTGRFEVMAVRDTTYDWMLREFPAGKHQPSVKEIMDQKDKDK